MTTFLPHSITKGLSTIKVPRIGRISHLLLLTGLLLFASEAIADKDIIVDGQFVVPAGQSSIKQVTVFNKHAKLVGSFAAAGGNDDIKVMVLNTEAYALWQKGNAVFTQYNSGKISTDEFKVKLSRGTYYLIFDNTFSMFTSKTVAAHIYLKHGD